MSPLRQHLAYWARTIPVRIVGVALVVLAYRPWESLHGVARVVVFAGAVLYAAWAAPGVDRRPYVTAFRWYELAAARRTTVLAAGVVVLAAFGDPAWWEAASVAALLVGYLVTSDPWSVGATAVRPARRVWGEAAGACAGALLVAAAAGAPGVTSGAGRAVGGVVLGVGLALAWWGLQGARRRA
ncbi:hypothetical protein AB0J38_04595 [Streptomyces sp. NPDC050095]|uniref:hypothetical protein n=1 Tax=unclassified Streptomyces TaxID=2593676 RepID=UPI00342DE461